MQVCPRFKLKNASSLKLSIELKKLFQPHDLTVSRQLLDRWLSIEVYEKQNFKFVLTPICDYMFGLSFLTTLDI